MQMLAERKLKEEIQRLAPFHHKVELPYGLNTYVPQEARRPVEYTRLSNLVRYAFPPLISACGGSLAGKRVLDVACNCGGFSVEAAKRGAEFVLGFDVVDHYIEQANFIRRALNLEQVEFKLMDLEQIDASSVGEFDITLCLGILYHLENPISSMKRLSAVTRYAMLVDTDLEFTSLKRRLLCGRFAQRPLWLMNVARGSTSDSKSATTSLWRRDDVAQFRPNDAAVIELLKFLGFQKVVRLKPELKGLEKRYYTGARGTFLAIRT